MKKLILLFCFVSTLHAADKLWTWRDRNGVLHSRAELDAILQEHRKWLDSSGSEGTMANLSMASLSGANLSRANLSGANLGGANLTKADLSLANLSKADLSLANLDANFDGENLTGVVHLEGADLREADLTNAKLGGADLTNADLTSAKLNGAELEDSDLRRANLEAADLSGADLSGAELREADLSGVVLKHAHLSGAHLAAVIDGENIIGSVHLDGADIREADLRGTSLRGAVLSQADLSGADLEGADLSRAWLNRAKLDGADLTNAKLFAAALNDADLHGAKLIQTDLSEAHLDWADLAEANYEPEHQPPILGTSFATGLGHLSWREDPEPIYVLRKSLSDAGFVKQARQVAAAIHRHGESWLERLLFDWTCEWGSNWLRPLALAAAISLFTTLVYWVGMHFQTKSGLYLAATGERITTAKGKERIFRIAGSTPNLRHRLRWEITALGTAFLFSLMSEFNIGFREFNFGRWIRMLQPREFDIRARGWMRTLSGIQSLIGVALVALSLLSISVILSSRLDGTLCYWVIHVPNKIRL